MATFIGFGIGTLIIAILISYNVGQLYQLMEHRVRIEKMIHDLEQEQREKILIKRINERLDKYEKIQNNI